MQCLGDCPLDALLAKKPCRTRTVTPGIDRGWDYNVGQTSLGERISADALAAVEKMGKEIAATRLVPADYDLDRLVPRPVSGMIDRTIKDTAKGIEAYLTRAMGGRVKVFEVPDRDVPTFTHRVVVDARSLAGHN